MSPFIYQINVRRKAVQVWSLKGLEHEISCELFLVQIDIIYHETKLDKAVLKIFIFRIIFRMSKSEIYKADIVSNFLDD